MNTNLQCQIFNGLKSVLSGYTSHVYFLYLPNEKLLNCLTCVFELNNRDNIATFESKEAIKTYSLKVKLNAPDTTQFGNLSTLIKTKMYTVGKMVRLVDEEVFYDNQLEVFTEFIQFEVNG
jgi:hypothetical protein